MPSSDGVIREPSSGRNAKDHEGDDESVDTEGSLCVENFVLLFKDRELAVGASIFPGERHQTCNTTKENVGTWIELSEKFRDSRAKDQTQGM